GLVGHVDGRTRRRSAGIHRDRSVLPAGVHVPRLLRVLPASPRRRGARPRSARAPPGRVRDGRWRLHAARRRPPTGPDPSRRLTRRRDERQSIGVLNDRGYLRRWRQSHSTSVRESIPGRPLPWVTALTWRAPVRAPWRTRRCRTRTRATDADRQGACTPTARRRCIPRWWRTRRVG